MVTPTYRHLRAQDTLWKVQNPLYLLPLHATKSDAQPGKQGAGSVDSTEVPMYSAERMESLLNATDRLHWLARRTRHKGRVQWTITGANHPFTSR